jgi:hypothetical protein
MNNAFQFAPQNYGDWASYAGFDRTTGTTDFGIAPPETKTASSEDGIEPPKTIGEYFDKQIKPLKDTYNQITAAGKQLAEGNMMNAYNTMQKPASQFGLSQPQQNNAISFDHLWN